MIVEVLAGVALVGFGLALYKHKTLAAVEASAKAEIANIEAAIAKAEPTVKAEVTAIVNRIKALF
jgi:hypothetical protein